MDEIQNLPHDRAQTVCDADESKQQLLADAVAALKLEDTFELAVAIRENLPAGLEADDFDGENIEAAKEAES